MPAIKTNIDGYIKNSSNLIVNTKTEDLQTYKNQVDKSKKINGLEKNVASLHEEVSKTQTELSEIKLLLLKLIEKNNV